MVNQSCLTTLQDLNTPIQNASYNLNSLENEENGAALETNTNM